MSNESRPNASSIDSAPLGRDEFTSPVTIVGDEAVADAIDVLEAYREFSSALGDEPIAVDVDVRTSDGRRLGTFANDAEQMFEALDRLWENLSDTGVDHEFRVDVDQEPEPEPTPDVEPESVSEPTSDVIRDAEWWEQLTIDGDSKADANGKTYAYDKRRYIGPMKKGSVAPGCYRFQILEALAGQSPLTNGEIRDRIARLFPEREKAKQIPPDTADFRKKGFLEGSDIEPSKVYTRQGEIEHTLTEKGVSALRRGLRTRAKHAAGEYDLVEVATASPEEIALAAEGEDGAPADLFRLYRSGVEGPGTHEGNAER